MRQAFIVLLALFMSPLHAQRLDPDQNPYWARYTIVEDSSVLVPLKGDYRVYYIQSGMWWNMIQPQYPIRDLPKESMRLLSLFRPGAPAFMATPARGLDHPDVRLVVVRKLDTMVVELSTYLPHAAYDVTDRCMRTDCTRRPPVVLPFRPGRFLVNGAGFGPDGAVNAEPGTTELTRQFDELWSQEMKAARVIPQLNTDTCRYEVAVPSDLDAPDTTLGSHGRNTDVWLMRSYHAGTHLARFPAWGTETACTITGGPGSGVDTSGKGAQLHFFRQEQEKQWLDLTGWPPGDYTVSLVAFGNGGSFILKLR